MNRLFVNNSPGYRLLRTIIQGVIGVLVANVDLLVGSFSFSPEVKAFIVALMMAILSPIMASLGTYDIDKDEIEHGYFEDGEEVEDEYSDSEQNN